MQLISINVERVFSGFNEHQRKHLEALANMEKISLEQYLFQVINSHLDEIEKHIPAIPQENIFYH